MAWVLIPTLALSLRAAENPFPPSQCLKEFPNARRISGTVRSPVATLRSELPNKQLAIAGFRCGDFLPVIEAVVGKDGRIACVHLVLPRNKKVSPEVAAVFERCVRSWRFKPATENGAAVEVLMYFTVNFRCA